MQQPHSPRNSFTASFKVAALGLLIAGACVQARADEPSERKPLALREIMHDLGENMQAITDAISHEDWEKVAKIAPGIADHPQPPMAEKMRILGFIGADAGRFRGYDKKNGQAARALEQAAASADGELVISNFATLQASCLACHQSFRKPFLEHFHEKR